MKRWDESLPDEDAQQWHRLTASWKKGSTVVIPRRLFTGPRSRTTFQLHIFTDASILGFGVAIYLRSSNNYGIQCRLAFARSKLIGKQPKHKSVPRLELQAAFIAIKIAEKMSQELSVPFTRIQLWSDSENLLKWLCQEEKQKDAYLNRRLEAISNWPVRHVAGLENPADILLARRNVGKIARNSAVVHRPGVALPT